ncbi:type III secretion system export apparatus subunit SctT [Nitratireductor soli]|uniref:type III secretion system export apparatus subunit SctT n=1 Tax=Nitratireductor soli TaxID=1670619 RepID=UPI00065E7413|nr:type III secretion system export apparatus subunit SctT [Nitratireductor soli]
MPFDALFTSVAEFELYVLAAAFALARFAGVMMVMPLFSRVRLTGLLRNGVALALSIPVIPMIAGALDQMTASPPLVVILMLKEFIIGATLGFVLGIPFWAAETAGDIVDLQRGSTMGALIDPMMTHETSTTGTFLTLIVMVLFLASGGIQLTVSTVYNSYGLWPVDSLMPIFSPQAAETFLMLLNRILVMALVLVFPLVISLLLSDVLLALLARASPHLNVFALSLVLKTLVFSLVLVLYASFLVFYMSRDLTFLTMAHQYIADIACPDCQ